MPTQKSKTEEATVVTAVDDFTKWIKALARRHQVEKPSGDPFEQYRKAKAAQQQPTTEVSTHADWIAAKTSHLQRNVLHMPSLEQAYDELLVALHKLEKNPQASNVDREVVLDILAKVSIESTCTGCGDLKSRYLTKVDLLQ